jgi:hypothetical protein
MDSEVVIGIEEGRKDGAGMFGSSIVELWHWSIIK